MISTQQGLNEVVMNKVQKMIARKSADVQGTLERLVNEGRIAQDYIAPIGVELKRADRAPVVTFSGNGHVLMNFDDRSLSLHPNAVSQLAARMNIPTAYLRALSTGDEWQRKLAASILNEHSGWTERSRVLVRSVGDEVRGVLSDSYRRLNSVDILTSFVESACGEGAVVADAYMTDTKVWAEAIIPQPLVIPTAKNGDVVIFAGARFATSDYGDGAVDMRAFLLNGACLNGMVRESVMKQVHLGSRLPDNLRLSQETYELDTRTTSSAIRDLTRGIFSKDAIMQRAIEIQGASEIDVDFEREIKALTSGGSLLKSEGKEVEKLLMKNSPDDGVQGGSTLWKLTQAITAHAREVDPARSRELHEISGALLNRVKVA